MTPLQIILAAIAAFPSALTAVEKLYDDVKADFSTDDQATVDKALEDAKAADAAKTKAADDALTS